jgi:hypothetical protein
MVERRGRCRERNSGRSLVGERDECALGSCSMVESAWNHTAPGWKRQDSIEAGPSDLCLGMFAPGRRDAELLCYATLSRAETTSVFNDEQVESRVDAACPGDLANTVCDSPLPVECLQP